MLDHRPQILALACKVKLVDLRVQDWADDGAPLIRAEDAVANVLQLRQIGAQIAACSEALDGDPAEPYGRQQQEDARDQAKIEPLRRIGLRLG